MRKIRIVSDILSRWCAAGTIEVDVLGEDYKTWKATPMSGHKWCQGERWHDEYHGKDPRLLRRTRRTRIMGMSMRLPCGGERKSPASPRGRRGVTRLAYRSTSPRCHSV